MIGRCSLMFLTLNKNAVFSEMRSLGCRELLVESTRNF